MKKVMIVDDNSLATEGIEKNIDWQSLDAEVSIIEYNSRSALEALKRTAVDLIISDIENAGSGRDFHVQTGPVHKSYGQDHPGKRL